MSGTPDHHLPRPLRLRGSREDGPCQGRRRKTRCSTQPSNALAGVSGVIGPIEEGIQTVEDLFASEHDRLVAGLAVAFDLASAEDAVQEAFITADRRWSRVVSLDDPAGWVRRVAVNRLLNGRRNRRRRDEILSTVRSGTPEDLTDDLLDLRASLGRMPKRMRTVMCLHYITGLRVDEVAETLGIATGTVKSTLHDGRRRLADDRKEARHD